MAQAYERGKRMSILKAHGAPLGLSDTVQRGDSGVLESPLAYVGGDGNALTSRHRFERLKARQQRCPLSSIPKSFVSEDERISEEIAMRWDDNGRI
jgi:hypothetical protein